MDLIKLIMPTLWQILDKNKKCSINVSTIDNKLTVNILFGKRRKRFVEEHNQPLLSQLQHFLAA